MDLDFDKDVVLMRVKYLGENYQVIISNEIIRYFSRLSIINDAVSNITYETPLNNLSYCLVS